MTEQLALGAQVIHERRSCCIKTKQFFSEKSRDCCGAVMVTRAVYLKFFLSILVQTTVLNLSANNLDSKMFLHRTHLKKHSGNG